MTNEELKQIKQIVSEAVKEEIYDIRDDLDQKTNQIQGEIKSVRMEIQNGLHILTNRVHKVEDQVKESIKATANYFELQDSKLKKRLMIVEERLGL